MYENDLELINDFVVESLEGMAEIEVDLLKIEEGGADIDSDLVNKVFRAIHSIKGAAGFLALSRIEKLAHSIEGVLSQVRDRTLVPTGPLVDRILKGSDVLRGMLQNVHQSNDCDVDEHVAALKAIVADQSSPAPAPGPSSSHSPLPAVTLDIPHEQVREQQAAGQLVLLTEWRPVSDSQAQALPELLQRLRDTGTILATTLPDEALGQSPQAAAFQILLATPLNPEQFAAFFQLPPDRVQLVPTEAAAPAAGPVAATDLPHPSIASAAKDGPDHPSMASVEQAHRPANPPAAPPVPAPPRVPGDGSAPQKKAAAEANIRVSVPVLDRLMNLAGELVLSRNQLLQTLSKGDRRSLELVGNRLDQVTTELQETIMRTRMQPVGSVFSKFARVVRDLSGTLGKQVQLEIEGEEVELDKSIIEGIGDPLTHLVRNAIDHGLETPQIRSAAGKSPTGTLRLRALHQEGKVLLIVSDDGAGIDAARIRRKAVEKGLLTAETSQSLSDREAVQLIFAPGFSTAETVTAVSGRGVGMDVVKTNFERLGGNVEIQTTVGQGTTITVRLPLTLAIIPSLITSCRGQRYAIPQGNIRELVRVSPADRNARICRVNQADVLRLRGSLLPLVHLGSIVGSPPGEQPNHAEDGTVTNIVIVETARLQFGLVVDRLHDSEEIVVKPLGRHLKGIGCLAGATVLGDGRIAMILDAAGLAVRAGLREDGSAAGSAAAGSAELAAESLPTLLFANHPQEWFGVPMSVVARIARIRTDQIDAVAGQMVLQYRGGTLPLLAVEECVQARPRPEQRQTYVVVFCHGGREMGLLAPEVLDIRNLSADMDTQTFRETGVLGSQIIDGRTVRFLDVFEIGNKRHPVGQAARSAEPAAEPVDGRRPPRILYAEDSTFFRNKVKKFLEAEGWQVTACEDGEAAWQELLSPQADFDLLLTDVEMPRMNGFELCEQVRRSARWSSLPVVAVTSLADDADRAHGIVVGFSEYMVKLNRDQLLTTLAAQLGLAFVPD